MSREAFATREPARANTLPVFIRVGFFYFAIARKRTPFGVPP